jgi:PsbN protein
MESSAFFFPLFLWSFLLSVTVYSIYVGFGPPSKRLRDPFEEHEDLFGKHFIDFFFLIWQLRKVRLKHNKVKLVVW